MGYLLPIALTLTIVCWKEIPFAKKFGGVTGDDPDYFLLTIKKWLNDTLSTDSIDFYLADYRFEDNSQDYIVTEWTFIDLTPLGPADSLQFSLSSTDFGMFGMNTPAYFCIDNVTTTDGIATSTFEETNIELLDVYPNPATTMITLKTHQPATPQHISIYSMTGQLVYQTNLQHQAEIDISNWSKGAYVIKGIHESKPFSQLIIKN